MRGYHIYILTDIIKLVIYMEQLLIYCKVILYLERLKVVL